MTLPCCKSTTSRHERTSLKCCKVLTLVYYLNLCTRHEQILNIPSFRALGNSFQLHASYCMQVHNNVVDFLSSITMTIINTSLYPTNHMLSHHQRRNSCAAITHVADFPYCWYKCILQVFWNNRQSRRRRSLFKMVCYQT